MKKWIRAVLAGTIILALILFGIFAAQSTQKSTKPEQNPEEQNTSVSENSTSDENTAENSTDDPDIIVKDNVKVITNEMKSEDQPTEVLTTVSPLKKILVTRPEMFLLREKSVQRLLDLFEK